MSAIVIHCGRPENRERATRTYTLSRPCAAARANQSHRERYGAILAHIVVSVRQRTVGAPESIKQKPVLAGLSEQWFSASDTLTVKSVRTPNSRQPFGAGNRILGSTRIEALQKSSHVRCPFTHVEISFLASFDVPERSEGVFGNVRKSFGEIRNV